jgi:DNA-directed RNA polymerase specialized sigma subunit
MEKDILNMSQKERQRYHLLQMVLDGKNNLKDAGKRMGVSYRHAKRLKSRACFAQNLKAFSSCAICYASANIKALRF